MIFGRGGLDWFTMEQQNSSQPLDAAPADAARFATRLNKDTTLCISLAARPSNHGVRFHNWLYQALDLNYVYKPVAPTDITSAVAGIRGLGIRGAAVSMPYKSAVIPLIDEVDPSADRIGAVNTIVNTDGELVGYNTDYIAVASLLRSHGVNPELSVAVRGSGGMGKAVVAAIADYGMRGTVVARNESTGSALAAEYGWEYSSDVPAGTQLLVNVTPLGMRGEHEDVQAFTDEEIAAAEVVFDVVAYPVATPLIKKARLMDKPVITGGEVVALQAVEQFELYTGVRPSAQLVEAAELYASS